MNSGIVRDNDKGYTLFEVVISIAVASIVLIMLMQILTMNISQRKRLEDDNRLFYQANSIVETIQKNIFIMQAQSIEVDPASTSSYNIININHDYDISLTIANTLYRDTSGAFTESLVLDLTNEQLLYDGLALHGSNFKILAGSSITLLEIDPATCAITPSDPICGQAILKIDIILTYEYPSGQRIESQRFTTTLLV